MTASKGDIVKNIIRWAARIIGSFAAMYMLIILIKEIYRNTSEFTPEGITVGIFSVILIFSSILSWFHAKVGGWILTISGVLYGVFIYFTAGNNEIPMSITISMPYWLSGIMFLISGEHKKKGNVA